MLKTKMKRVVSMDPYQSRPINEEARVNLKYQILLQEYLELQKEFISKKRRLQNATVNRETLLAEVRFLRKKHKYLLKVQSPKGEQEFVQRKNSDICFYNVGEAVPKHQSPQFWNDGERSLDCGEAAKVVGKKK
ncbi:hypothetical protein F2P56_026264 [Juglans regia]|uniref:Uncharacterized protein n=2 Tax=Juglans regia TaxID=51240 RepID=A0A833UF28_JUGRE|nr:uncharacterized protein LOC109005222 [Juglans regia]KAF5456828.1 hypothetical protein F2P56_026264 [Juglans regia]